MQFDAGDPITIVPNAGLAWVLNRFARAVEGKGGNKADWLYRIIAAGAQDLTSLLATGTHDTLNIPAVALGRRGYFTLTQAFDAYESAMKLCAALNPHEQVESPWQWCEWDDGSRTAALLMLNRLMEIDRGKEQSND